MYCLKYDMYLISCIALQLGSGQYLAYGFKSEKKHPNKLNRQYKTIKSKQHERNGIHVEIFVG